MQNINEQSKVREERAKTILKQSNPEILDLSKIFVGFQ
jgi:hypothetical protein